MFSEKLLYYSPEKDWPGDALSLRDAIYLGQVFWVQAKRRADCKALAIDRIFRLVLMRGETFRVDGSGRSFLTYHLIILQF